ncbi:MAG TPA: hypothetical protein VFX70_01060 [Mycobacteriales bacterium]|nr:hypothetical protein [Mycobacteriales bacterium]
MEASGELAERHGQSADAARAGVVVVVRFLVARTAVDQLKRFFRLGWFVAAVGLVLVFSGPRLVGVALLALSLLLAMARGVTVWVVERTAVARAYRDVREDLASAVEAGKANVRRELERVGLPSSRWRMPLFVLGLGRRSGRTETSTRLEHVNLEQVLPRAQIDRAMTILHGVWSRAA